MYRIASTLVVLAALAPSARAATIHFDYIGVDSQQTITSGTYVGLANPNANRLTFLYGHQDTSNPPGNHFHSKGVYSYTGPNLGAATAVVPYNGVFGTGNNVHDTGSYNLFPGSGSLSGLYVSGLDPSDLSGNTLLRSVDVLSGAPANSADWFQFHSASNRWTTSLAGTHLELTLVGVTGGASVVDSSGNVLLSKVGDTYDLGAGDAMAFTPILAKSSFGSGQLVFTLHDLNGLYGDSGQFVYNLNTIDTAPEPASIVLMGIAAVGFAGTRLRRKASAKRPNKSIVSAV